MNQTESKPSLKLIKCYEYGILRKVPNADEETWIFNSNDYDYEFVNSDLVQTLDDLSMEGWDLVCKDGLEFILRQHAEKEEPQPYEGEDEDED